MISLKPNEQLEFSFYPRVCWIKLSGEEQHEILKQLSLFLLSYLENENEPNQSTREDQLCQVK